MKQVSEFVPVRFRSGFNDDGTAAGEAAGLRCEDVSLAVQDPRDEVDINSIVSRYLPGGMAPQVTRVPLEGDFSDITDFHSALAAVEAARAAFMSQDAKVRERFGNDPGAFHDFCVDPGNLPELRKLGLAAPAPEVPDAPPPPPPAA